MGIYDRPYYRDDRGASWLSGRSMVVNLILLNVAVYIAQFIFDGRQETLTQLLALHADLLERPWHVYQLLSYGFAHDPNSVAHIAFNMFGVWLFGTDLEGIYGRAEFLRIYLAALLIAGLVWFGIEVVNDRQNLLLGASGGVMGLMVLYVLHFPKRIFYIWGVLPLPAWALGGLYVVMDVTGFMNPGSSNVANVAHLAGMAFGLAYYQTGMNLGRLVPRRLSDLNKLFRFRPKLKIHDPEQDARDLNAQVDEILEKISRQGEASLTKAERRTLEEASRRYQRRRN
jgi:membrane associated rhomboid family serine protease